MTSAFKGIISSYQIVASEKLTKYSVYFTTPFAVRLDIVYQLRPICEKYTYVLNC